MDKYKILEDSVLRIYEGLSRKMINEGASLDDINNKINTIMDALGLADNTKTEEKPEPKVEEPKEEEVKDTVTIEDDMPTEGKEDSEDTFTVDESLEVKEEDEEVDAPYILILNRDIADYTGSKMVGFNTLDELYQFIQTELPLRTSYRDLGAIEQGDYNKDEGTIFVNMWYKVVKKGNSDL